MPKRVRQSLAGRSRLMGGVVAVVVGGGVVLHTLRILFFVRYGVKMEGGRRGWKCKGKTNALSCREVNDCSEFEHLKSF